MDQLAAATGLHKPSLYGAFGDKKRIFIEALQRYLADASEQFAAALSRPSLVDSLSEMAARAIVMFTRDGPRGCFMMQAAVPEASEDAEVTGIVRKAMEGLDRALVRRFQRAIDEGELAASADPQALAMMVAANHYDLSARARAGYSVDELQAFAARSLALVKQVGGLRADP
jgi:AcrR family transcriptional regulator